MPVAIPLAIAGASVAGAAISSGASRDAARTQEQGNAAAVAEQRRQFDAMLALARPGLDRANSAAGTYMQALGLGGPSQPQQAAPQPGYQPQPGGVQSGGYNGASHGGSALQGYDMSPDLAVGPGQRGQRLMTGGVGGPQVMPQAPGTAPQPGQPGQPAPAPGQPAQGTGQLDIASLVRNTPGYQNQMQDGITSIDRAAPLVGGMYSGRRMKALNDHGQRTFGSYYENWMNRVGGIAGQAPQIAQNVGQAGMQSANNIGGLMVNGANARAQGQVNSASAWTGALGNIGGMMGASQGYW